MADLPLEGLQEALEMGTDFIHVYWRTFYKSQITPRL